MNGKRKLFLFSSQIGHVIVRKEGKGKEIYFPVFIAHKKSLQSIPAVYFFKFNNLFSMENTKIWPILDLFDQF